MKGCQEERARTKEHKGDILEPKENVRSIIQHQGAGSLPNGHLTQPQQNAVHCPHQGLDQLFCLSMSIGSSPFVAHHTSPGCYQLGCGQLYLESLDLLVNPRKLNSFIFSLRITQVEPSKGGNRKKILQFGGHIMEIFVCFFL